MSQEPRDEPVIRTPDRRLRVFVSSTLGELADERRAVSRAIEALRLMEDGRYRHLPIVAEGRVIGIVSRFDFSGLELDRLNEETGLWERI